VTVFRPSGRTIKIVGNKGLYNRREGWINIQGQARFSLAGGYQLQSESFLYRLKEQELTTQDRVDMSGPGLHIQARGLKVDVTSWKATFLGEVASEWHKTPENKGV